MDFEYFCKAYPNISESDYGTELSLCPVSMDPFFNVEFEIIRSIDATHSNTFRYTFYNILKNNMKKENVESMLSSMGLPNDAFRFVVPKVLECADEIANTTMYKNTKILSMAVYIIVVPASHEDEIDDEDDDDDYDQDFGLVPSAAMTSIEEGLEMVMDAENYDDGYDDDDDDGGFEEYLEEGDEDFGLVPAAMTSIEELEMQEEYQQEGNCAICFEDFHVGVRMPCLHMFHRNCITSWLQVANSCPLCRFQMPITINDEQN